MARTKKTRRQQDAQRERFQRSPGRRGRSSGAAEIAVIGPITRLSRRSPRGKTEAAAVSTPPRSKTARTTAVPSSVPGKGGQKKVVDPAESSEKATRRAPKRNLDVAKALATPGKGKSPPPAKRTRQSRKYQCGLKRQKKGGNANSPSLPIGGSDDGDESWSGSEEGTGKKKSPVHPVRDQIPDQTLKPKSMKAAKSKTIPSQNEEKKVDRRMLKSTKDGVMKEKVFDKPFDHTKPPQIQFDEYNPWSPNHHHPLISIVEATGRETTNGKKQTLSQQKGWRSAAISVPFSSWSQSVISAADRKSFVRIPPFGVCIPYYVSCTPNWYVPNPLYTLFSYDFDDIPLIRCFPIVINGRFWGCTQISHENLDIPPFRWFLDGPDICKFFLLCIGLFSMSTTIYPLFACNLLFFGYTSHPFYFKVYPNSASYSRYTRILDA